MVREPFNVPARDIPRLTRYQLRYQYFRPRDEEGELVREDSGDGGGNEELPAWLVQGASGQAPNKIAGYEKAFRNALATSGLPQDEIDRRWLKWQAQLEAANNGQRAQSTPETGDPGR